MSNISAQPPPGTADIFPAEAVAWRAVEDAARRVFSLYGYGEIRTPVIEFAEVFERGLGDETEVVQKEMYTFEDKGGRRLALRPEGTAGVARAMAGTEAANGAEARYFYMGPMFRGERPAAGRRRQFHQIGVECAGPPSPARDAECVAMLVHFAEEAGAGGGRLLVNTRGAPEDRAAGAEALRRHFSPVADSLCDDCKTRLSRNVWRVLDCKDARCQAAIEACPPATSLFGAESMAYFERVLRSLDAMGVAYEVAPRLVRGLDYYGHTVFELTHPGLGAQSALAGGGRYEISPPGFKRPLAGVGFALGVERLLMARVANGVPAPPEPRPSVHLAALGDAAAARMAALAVALRRLGVAASMDMDARSLKAQMRSANRLGARLAAIAGDDELARGVVTLKDLSSGAQREAPGDAAGLAAAVARALADSAAEGAEASAGASGG